MLFVLVGLLLLLVGFAVLLAGFVFVFLLALLAAVLSDLTTSSSTFTEPSEPLPTLLSRISVAPSGLLSSTATLLKVSRTEPV